MSHVDNCVRTKDIPLAMSEIPQEKKHSYSLKARPVEAYPTNDGFHA